MDPVVKKIEALIDAFYNLHNPQVSDLEQLVIDINSVIDEVELTDSQVMEINEMIGNVSITYTIGGIDLDNSSFEQNYFDYDFDYDFNDESSSIDPLSDEDDEDDEFNWDYFDEDE